MNGAPPTSAPIEARTFPFVVSPVLAHQGGWDEALLVLTPLAAIGGLLWLANRRVQRQLDEQSAVTDEQSAVTDEQSAVTDQQSGDQGRPPT